MEQGYQLRAKQRPQLLLAMMKTLARTDARISFEGNLSHTELVKLREASFDETQILRRNTTSPKMDFLVLPLTGEMVPVIEKAVVSKVAFNGYGGIVHVQIERDGRLGRVYIWLSNESTASTWPMGTCCEKTFLDKIQVIDAHGRRLESSLEIFERKTGSHADTGCDCSGPPTRYQPGFCGVIDSGTLNRPDTAYDLPPGAYVVEEKVASTDPSRSLPHTDMADKVTGLAISIEKP